jgi:hypothetical protein
VSAIQFTMRMQQFCATQPALNRLPTDIRVGLFYGVVTPTEDDVFGSGVNQAARIVGKANPGEVLVNKLLVDSIKKIWGEQKTVNYFSFKENVELKGIQDPPLQELYIFNWKQYSQDIPGDSLAYLVYDHLQQASVEVSNLSIDQINKPGLVIWPVVPRDLATAIHRGQAEIIRLLALLGWQIKLLVVDCGTKNFTHSYCDQFCNRLKKYLETRDVSLVDIIYMSDLYEPTHVGYKDLQSIFRKVTSDLSLEDLLAINNKTYNQDIKEKLKRAATIGKRGV